MSIWLLTIGNSDVLLSTDQNWDHLKRKVQDRNLSKFNKPPKLPNGLYAAPARSLGLVYGQQFAKHSNDLCFARLDALYQQFERSNAYPQRVIILLTDQSTIFDDFARKNINSPYWQDTCELRSLLESYFSQKLPDTEQTYLYVKPESDQPGLDHWDSTLSLIQTLLKDISVPERQTVYVSHQAGTPALSSAVQFVCLAKFGSDIQFLVSNEYQENSLEVIQSSTYLRGLRLQEGKAMLARYDYASAKEILSSYLSLETEKMLDAAIQWNVAEFNQFAEILLENLHGNLDIEVLEKVRERTKPENEWWWRSYEAAYLAVVRLRQGNTVEAMFHSFRSLEGLGIKYAEHKGIKGKYGQKVFKYLRSQKQKEWCNHPYMSKLVDLESDDSVKNDLLKKRNTLFHQLSGLQKEKLFDAWQTTEQDWQAVVLSCLNFISSQQFTPDLEEVSLMAKVHDKISQKLEAAINNPELQA